METESAVKKIRVGILSGLIGFIAPSMQGAEIKSVSENQFAVVGTEQKIFVYVDNTGLGGEPTDGVQWKLSYPAGFQYIANSVQAPTVNDFFAGMPMFWEIYQAPPGGLSARVVEEIGGGSVDTNGFVGEYRFITPQTPGSYTFPLTSTVLFNPDGQAQPRTVSAVPLVVVRNEPADFDKNGSVDNADYQHFSGCMTGPGAYQTTLEATVCTDADFDFDGDVDQRDYRHFQEQFTGEGNPVQ